MDPDTNTNPPETEVWTQMVSTELPALAGHAVAVSYVKSTLNGLLHIIFLKLNLVLSRSINRNIERDSTEFSFLTLKRTFTSVAEMF